MPGTKARISISRLIMQYLRWLPHQLGLLNHGAFMLQLKEIKADDTFVVSYPKSGNTWLRFVLAYMIDGSKNKLSFQEVDKIVPDVYVSKDWIDKMESPRFIKTHDVLLSHFPKTIYIVRDYRDVLISFYYYKIALKEFEGDFSKFVRSNEITEPFGSWKEHVSKALFSSKENSNRILFLHYENMKNNFEQTLHLLSEFTGLKNFELTRIKELTNFENLQQTESESGSEFMNRSGKKFFREGKTGSWKEFISADDLKFIYSDSELVSLLNQLNYKIEETREKNS